jgi:RHS repeat-associated protein
MRRGLVVAGLALSALSCGWAQAPVFGTTKPERGIMPYGVYSLTDIESIDQASGSLGLRIPLAALPPGRAGFSHSVDLLYTSQIFDLTTVGGSPVNSFCGGGTPCPTNTNALEPAANTGGGWQYAMTYRFEAIARDGNGFAACSGVPDVSTTTNLWRYSLIFPDGSSHLLRLQGGLPGTADGYYPYAPNGSATCTGGGTLSLPLRLYTTDGTYVQVTKSTTGWVALFPDGRKVSTNSTWDVAWANSICDRNGNCATINRVIDSDGSVLTHLVDDFGRMIRIKHVGSTGSTCPNNPYCFNSQDQIFRSGYGGPATDPAGPNHSLWTVTWGVSAVGAGDPVSYTCSSPVSDPNHTGTCRLTTYVRNVQQVTLPTSSSDNLRYQFCYADDGAETAKRGFGELISIGLPNGTTSSLGCGSPSSFRPRVDYSYRYSRASNRDAAFSSENAVLAKTLYRHETVLSGGEDRNETWTYAYPVPGTPTGTITAPDGGVTTNSFFLESSGRNRLIWKTTSPLGATVERFWAYNEPWIGVTAALDRKNIYVRAEFRKPVGGNYHATAYTFDKNGNMLSETNYANGVSDPASPPAALPSGTVLRTTTHQYHHVTPEASQLGSAICASGYENAYWGCSSTPVYKQARFRTNVIGQSGGAESATQWQYDNAGTTGNVVSERRWDSTKSGNLPANGTPGSPGLDLDNSEIATFSWSQGNLLTATTPDGDLTTTVRDAAGCGTNLYATQVKRHDQNVAVRITEDFTYDCATGVEKTATNVSDVVRTIREVTDYDRFARPTSTYTATGSGYATKWRQRDSDYNDAGFSSREIASVDGPTDLRMAAVVSHNPAGYVQRRRWSDESSGAVTDSSNTGVVTVREYLYANPYRYELENVPYSLLTSPQSGSAGIPLAWRRRKFDRDGRLIAEDVIKRAAVASAAPEPWSGSSGTVVSSQTWSYSGYSVTITDAAGKTRTETRDALGRLTSVAQPGSATAGYTYPARQMVVTQADAATQTRTFTYTSLGRLASAANPESGTTSYTYHPGGQLWTKSLANGVVTTMTYDGAQRLLTKSYSDSTPSILYCYDGQRYSGGSCAADGSGRSTDAADFPKGQLTGLGNSLAATNYERIDALGRVTRVRQVADGLAGDAVISYTYGSGGAVKSITYPSGRVVTFTLGDTGRPTQLSGTFAAGNTTYASAVKYTPGGALLSGNWAGSSLVEKRDFNELGQATQIEVLRGTQLVHRLGYTYPATGNNGNVTGHSIATPQRTWNQYFGYDSANRLRLAMERSAGAPGNPSSGSCTDAQGTWTGGEWCQQFGFDGFGNVWSVSGQTFGTAPLVANGSSWYQPSTNRYKDVGYDAAGHQTQLQVNNALLVTDYDGEGRIFRRRDTSVGTTLFEYGYGAGGQRVRKTVGGVVTRYVYGADGELVAEYGPAGTSGSAGPEYLLTDALGSTRTKTNGSGLALARFDYEPFGAEIGRHGSGGDGLRQRFTGKERDAESGLDYFGARYLASGQGRFTSADEPLVDQHESDPQSWNLFSYVRNNPLRFTDPTGRCSVDGQGGYVDEGSGLFSGKCSEGQIGGTEPQKLEVSEVRPPSPELLALAIGMQRAKPIVNAAAVGTAVVATGGFAGMGYGAVTGGIGIHQVGVASGPAAYSLLPEIGRKLDYVFGLATGALKNIQRSTAMLAELRRIGLHDTSDSRSYLRTHLGRVLNDSSSIVSNSGGRTVRESFLMGPAGGVKLESVWEGSKLITVKVFGGAR